MNVRSLVFGLVGVLVALVLQTTLFGRIRLGGISPDLVLVVILFFAVRTRSEAAIIFGFTAGLVFDALSSTALGLRAGVYTAVAFIAIRTIDRMDSSPLSVALWVGLLTISGVVLFLLVGTIFGQVTMDMGEAMRRVILVPLYNLVVALLLAPLSTRLLAPARHRFI